MTAAWLSGSKSRPPGVELPREPGQGPRWSPSGPSSRRCRSALRPERKIGPARAPAARSSYTPVGSSQWARAKVRSDHDRGCGAAHRWRSVTTRCRRVSWCPPRSWSTSSRRPMLCAGGCSRIDSATNRSGAVQGVPVGPGDRALGGRVVQLDLEPAPGPGLRLSSNHAHANATAVVSCPASSRSAPVAHLLARYGPALPAADREESAEQVVLRRGQAGRRAPRQAARPRRRAQPRPSQRGPHRVRHPEQARSRTVG